MDDDEPAAGTRAMMPSGEADAIAAEVRTSFISGIQSGPQAATIMPGLYTQDIVFSDETEQFHSGHALLREAFVDGLPEGLSFEMRSFGAVGSGDLIVDMGSYTLGMPTPPGAPAERQHGRYMMTLQRMDDGTWKIVRHMAAERTRGDLEGAQAPATADTVEPPFTTSPAPKDSTPR